LKKQKFHVVGEVLCVEKWNIIFEEGSCKGKTSRILSHVGVRTFAFRFSLIFNPLNAELNPICHLLAILGAHHILHISRIGVKNFLLSTSAIYIVTQHIK